ncbi:MAG: hypothetical protein K6G26_09315 [Lachnospiraceae bacterium]|nr:hypothetical protein [Lachnospiraceae bacterium]
MITVKEYLDNKELSSIDITTKIYREFLAPDLVTGIKNFREVIFYLFNWDYSRAVKPSDEELNYLAIIDKKYHDLMQQIVYALAKNNPEEEAFYIELYKLLFTGELFPKSEKDRGILLFILVKAIKGVKYYKAENVVRLDEKEFDDIVANIMGNIDRALSMIDNRFDTKSEMASQLCQIADKLDSEKEKVVFWGVVIGEARKLKENS